MIASYDDFIGVYDGVFSDPFCSSVINYFEHCHSNNLSFKRIEAESIKKDDSVCLNPYNQFEINFMWPNISSVVSEFNDKFWNICYKDYVDKYSTLSTYSNHTIYTYKVQKTIPGGGYHVWHPEDGDRIHCARIGVYILYLNDIEEGGETEFLYLSRRVSAKKGRLVIFPPNYPWTHRGNPPLSGIKYIMTGWIEFS